MKTVILCGGRGTRLGEHGITVPKALIEIGGRPVLWHLMKIYSAHGLRDFVLCLGYLGDSIRKYFAEQLSDAGYRVDMTAGGICEIRHSQERSKDWRITFVDTGENTNTGGRLRQIKSVIGEDPRFCATYGDGLSNVDIRALISFHQSHGRSATLTAVNPRSSFGVLSLGEHDKVVEFREKPLLNEWINGGFFVFEQKVFDYISGDCVMEREPFEALAGEGELVGYRHRGFWKCLDTYKDHLEFNQLWDEGLAEWKVW